MKELRFIDFGKADVCSIMAANESLYRTGEETGEEVGFLWTAGKSIIMGYSQVIEKELNLERCRELGYKITRRISGGGMAFSSQDSQVQYGFIGNLGNQTVPLDMTESYRKVCGIVIHALERFGLSGEFKPINDVLCKGKKISGSAQTRGSNVLLQHGTLLCDFDIKEMMLCCNIPLEKISDKGIKSVGERVTDLQRVLGRKVSLQEADEAMRYGFEKNFNVRLREDKMSTEEQRLAQELLPKYYDPDWVFRYTRRKTRSAGEYPKSPELSEYG